MKFQNKMPGNYGNKKKKNNKKSQKPGKPQQQQQEQPSSCSDKKPTAPASAPIQSSDVDCAQKPTEETISSTKASQLPPIIAVKKDFDGLKAFVLDIIQHLVLKDSDIVVHYSGKTARVSLRTQQQYKKMIKYLVERKINYFTYTSRDEKPFSYVVKNLSTDLPEMSVKLAFVALKFNVIKLRKISKMVWFLQLKSKGNTGNITKVKNILDHDVTIEKFKRRHTVQCRNCQRLGHTAYNCCFDYRCVKCSGSHDPGMCSIPKRKEEDKGKLPNGESLLKCALCGEGHAANFKYCPFKVTYEENQIKQSLITELRRACKIKLLC